MKPQINLREVARYLGYKNNNIHPQTLKEIEQCVVMLEKCIKPQTHYGVFQIDKENGIALQNSTLKFEGESAKNLLQDCKACVLVIVTLGASVDELLRKLQITNLSQAVTTDFCASSMVENLAGKFEEQLKEKLLSDGEFFTDRFSPGYGDMHISIQKLFCDVLDAERKVGVCVNSGGIMIPRKTITAVIGIANKPQQMKIKGCEFCDLKNDCEFRKGGRTCD